MPGSFVVPSGAVELLFENGKAAGGGLPLEGIASVALLPGGRQDRRPVSRIRSRPRRAGIPDHKDLDPIPDKTFAAGARSEAVKQFVESEKRGNWAAGQEMTGLGQQYVA